MNRDKYINNVVKPHITTNDYINSSYDKQMRRSSFWNQTGQLVPYVMLGYFIGYGIGLFLVFYIFIWPFIKMIFE